MNRVLQNLTIIDIEKFNSEEASILSQILKKNGTLYSTKPKKASGDAKYIWRMLSFYISNNSQLQCIPTTADFDLETYDENGKWNARMAMNRSKELDRIVDSILSQIPDHLKHGLLRWKKVFN